MGENWWHTLQAVPSLLYCCLISMCTKLTKLVQLGTHLSMRRSALYLPTLNCFGMPVWTAQTTWGIHSEHAHALCEADLIIVGPSTWVLFCACSVWTDFLPFLLSRWRRGVFYVTRNKMLFSSRLWAILMKLALVITTFLNIGIILQFFFIGILKVISLGLSVHKTCSGYSPRG